MRLLRFHVRKHLLLQDLDLRFDRPGRLDTGQYALDFLVGVNGSGKSTLLRALMQVFVYLENGGKRPFEFELEYELNNNSSPIVVSISELDESTEQGFSTRRFKIINKHTNEVLEDRSITSGSVMEYQHVPKRKIVYSTGSEKEWEYLLTGVQSDLNFVDVPIEVFGDSIQRSIIELPGSMAKSIAIDKANDEPTFWLMQARNLPIITLCGLLAHLAKENSLIGVLEALKIQSIAGFSLRFRLHPTLSRQDEYKQLAKFASQHLCQGTDHLLYFDFSSHPELAVDLLKEFNNGFELYHRLELNTRPDETGQPTLQQVNIFMQRATRPVNEEEAEESKQSTIPNLFLLDWLSDGEQSFLGRMALLAMLDTDDSLILLDEPEVHFNDYWKREIVSLLDAVMSSHTNHLLITTHSSILLSDVTDDQITVMFKNEDGISQHRRPGVKTFGADPSEIMTVLFQTEIPSGRLSTESLTVAVTDGNRETVEGYLQTVGPGMWRFRLKQRLGEIDASSD